MAKKLIRKTRRLVVRPLTKSDYAEWKKAYLEMPPPGNEWDFSLRSPSDLSKSAFNKLLKSQSQKIKQDTFYSLAVFDKSGALVGGVSIMEVVRGLSHTAYLGYRIFRPYWRMGYGKEATKACIDIAFRDVKLHRIEAGIDPHNQRSIRLANSLGMRREGLKKRALHLRGKWVDLLMYTLTTEDVGYKFDENVFKPRRRG